MASKIPANTLSEDTVSTLRALIELNDDSEKGFRHAAENIDEEAISEMFLAAAGTRAGFAQELRVLLAAGGERPPATPGTALGTIHRWWVSIRGKIARGQEYPILAEAERGEDAIKGRYEKALQDGKLDQPAQSVIARQYESIKRTHDRVRDLRDTHAVHQRAGGPANRDAITGESGAHPMGVGLGAVGAGVAGAAVGSVAGPVGTALGAAAGAVAGGLIGKSMAERVDPTIENEYWRENFRTRGYVPGDADYTELQPAYKMGWEAAGRYQGRSFDDVELQLRRDWEGSRHSSRLAWDRARSAARDAWDRVVGGGGA